MPMWGFDLSRNFDSVIKAPRGDTVHPYVASVIANEIVQDRAAAARHARQARRRQRRGSVRRAVTGR
jgi:hypothetical protein